MKTVIVKYDPSTGQVYDKNDVPVFSYSGLQADEAGASIDTLVKLKNAGYSAEDIIELKRAGIL